MSKVKSCQANPFLFGLEESGACEVVPVKLQRDIFL